LSGVTNRLMRGQRRWRSFTGLAEIQRWNRSRTGSCGNEPSGSRPGGHFFSNQIEACLRLLETRPRPLPKRAIWQRYRATSTFKTPHSLTDVDRSPRAHRKPADVWGAGGHLKPMSQCAIPDPRWSNFTRGPNPVTASALSVRGTEAPRPVGWCPNFVVYIL
jgi:hypothetical protein